MRIITGKARGVNLVTLAGENTRPTAERTKEAVFSMLQFDLEGREVLDLFAGSGQLGLEAISRGAAHAVFVDQSKQAIQIITDNARKTKLEDACSIYNANSLDFIRRNLGKKFDIIFLDPPYASGLYQPILSALCESEMLKPFSMIVCESNTDRIFENNKALQEKFTVKRQTTYSKTVITILTVNEERV